MSARRRSARGLARLLPRASCWAGLALVVGCGDTGQSRVTFDLAAAGAVPETMTVGGWEVTVREARVAFGPLVLCTARNAGLESCAQAAAEHLGATSFDALSGAPSPMGEMRGTSGSTVLSAMWDYGRAWRLPDTAPRPLAGAVDGAHSAILEVEARRTSDDVRRTYRFVLDVDGGAQPSGSTAVRARLVPHAIAADEAGLVVRFDPSLWASMVDYEGLAARVEASATGPSDVPPDDPASAALSIALTTTGLPVFEWRALD